MPDAVDGVITITTAEQLAALAKNVNDGNSYSGQTIKLGSDLDLSGHNWTPIGWYDDTNRVDYYFKGTFDGDGHTISNLTIGGSNSYVGLFGQVGEGGTVKDLTLTDVNVSGNSYVGGLVGKNKGTITNCTVTGSIFSGDDYVGGLVGDNRGEVSGGTVNNVEVNSSYRIVGGLIGYNGGTVTGGTVNGGKVTSNGNNVGGLVGYNAGTVTGGTVNNVEVSGVRWVGGLTGYNKGGTVSGNTKLYKLTLPSGVGASGDSVRIVDNVTYAAGTVTLKASAANAIIRSTNSSYTNNDDGTVSVTPTADTSISSSDIAFYYAISGLNNITASGGTYKTVNGTNYYAANSSVTLSSNVNGAIIGAATASGGSVTVNSNGTVTLTTTSSAATVTPTLYYKLTLPNGFTASGTGYGGNYSDYYTGNVTIAERTGYSLSQTSIENISSATEITATVDTTNHYAFKDGDGYTYATDSNVASNNYPDLVQVYALTLSDGVTVTGDTVAKDSNGNTYATGTVTLTAAKGYTLQNVKVDGTTYDGNTLTVNADTKILADCIKFNNTNISKATAAEVGGTTGNLSTFNGVYSISASQENSTLTGNGKNNTIILNGGGENILTGGGGNDTYKFESGGGIVTDFGIGATKDGAGKTLPSAPGSDVVKVSGKVSGVYFDRDASSKKSAKFTAVVTYGSGADNDTQIIILQNINKKPTKTGSKPVYQTNDVAAATLKIWDTSGSKQAVLSAAKLKKLFHDDSDLTDDLKTQLTTLSTNLGIGDLNLPAVDALNQTAQATFNGGDNG